MSANVPYSTVLTDAIAIALRGIKRENGYRTNIGNNALVGDHDASQTDAPAVILMPSDEAPGARTLHSAPSTIQYAITGFLDKTVSTYPEYTEDPTSEYAMVDAVLNDIRDAIAAAQLVPNLKALDVSEVGARRLYNKGDGKMCGALVRYDCQICSGAPA